MVRLGTVRSVAATAYANWVDPLFLGKASEVGEKEEKRMNLRASLMAYRRLHEESVQHPDPSAQTGASAVKAYYAFVTQSYLRGWGESFHLAPRQRHESRMESLHRLEYYLAARLGLTPGQHVLDVGCGVGGPMRSIARFSGATVTGITISPDQVAIGNKLNRRDGLARQCTCLEGDFMTMQLPDASFDAAYTIEALCHATDRAVVFSEIHRVLRPAGLLVGVDQCMTSLYDDKNEKQRRIKRGIELGSGIAKLTGQHQLKIALQTSGFEPIEAPDL